MNNRKRARAKWKKQSALLKDIRKIQDLCLEINGLKGRKRGYTKELPTTFYEYCGHIACLLVRIYLSGWYGGADPDITYDIYLSGPLRDQKEIERCISDLKCIRDAVVCNV